MIDWRRLVVLSSKQRGKEAAKVQSVDRALNLLEHLIVNGATSLGELAKDTGLKPSTAHNLLATLLSRGYVSQNSIDRTYFASSRILELAGLLRRQNRALPLLEAAAQTLGAATGETVFVGQLEGLTTRMFFVIQGTHALVANPQPGSRLHSTALGKVLLAYAPDYVVQQFVDQEPLAALTSATITDERQLREELGRVRAAGVAFNWGEESASVYGIAAPVLDWAGTLVAAICVGYPAERDTPVYREELLALLQAQVREVSRCLGYTG
jgi:IclR family KDG regulon transcriptional repressor